MWASRERKSFWPRRKSFGREKIFVGESGEKKFLAATKKFWVREKFLGESGEKKFLPETKKFWARENFCRRLGREKVFAHDEKDLGLRKTHTVTSPRLARLSVQATHSSSHVKVQPDGVSE